jgi:hypothetical protein
MTSFTVTYRQSKCIEVKSNGTSYKFYRIPYSLLESGKHGIVPDSKFVVYLLKGKDKENRDCLYVGTSTNGIENRPTSHGDKKVAWETCIIFTSFDPTFLNDSKIRYIEDRLRCAIDETKEYINTTKSTSGKGTNDYDNEDCDKAMPYILEVYDLMGINIMPKRKVELGDFLVDKPIGSVMTAGKGTDYSQLKLTDEMKDWFKTAESIVKELDPQIIPNVTSTYANFKYPGVSKTVAYFYPNKREGKVRVLLQGTPDWYNDPKVTPRPENMHNGDCKAMFFITCDADLKYFRLFAEIAVQRLGKR